jgi:hypothetical protein
MDVSERERVCAGVCLSCLRLHDGRCIASQGIERRKRRKEPHHLHATYVCLCDRSIHGMCVCVSVSVAPVRWVIIGRGRERWRGERVSLRVSCSYKGTKARQRHRQANPEREREMKETHT